MSNDVFVLFEGYSQTCGNVQKANCTCTLVKGEKNIIIDTMTAWDGKKILKALASLNFTPDSIDYVISTHGHSDHTGNNNLFLNATHIVGFSISKEDEYIDHAFQEGVVFSINKDMYILPTPGHTLSCVSLIIHNVKDMGTVAVTGDLFEKEEDLNDDSIWQNAGSENQILQNENRKRVLSLADWIIPGHGPKFKVPTLYKNNIN